MDAHAPLGPHRPLFATAALLWLLAALWWASRVQDPGPATLLPAGALHALLMSLGFMPLFFAGFAFTAPPRWLNVRPPDGRRLAPWAGVSLLGWSLLLFADAHQLPTLARLALLLPALSLAVFSGHLLRLCANSEARPSPHARAIAAGLAGCALLLLITAFFATQAGVVRRIALLGLHLCVGGTFAVALQRLTPFLHSEGRRRLRLLALLLCGLSLRGLLASTPAAHAVPGLPIATAMLELLLAALLARDATQPSLAKARRTPLVAQLWISYLWLAASFVLDAAAQLGWLPAAAGLHALTLGFMGGNLLAMVSRVTAVQHGRSVAADRFLYVLQLLLQAVLLTRIVAVLWPSSLLLGSAASGFALLALGWCLRYLPWLVARAPARKSP